jgi:hypothetical protein
MFRISLRVLRYQCEVVPEVPFIITTANIKLPRRNT